MFELTTLEYNGFVYVDAIDVGVARGYGIGDLLPEFGGYVFVGIDTPDPLALDIEVGQCPIELLGLVLEGVLNGVSSHLLGNVEGAVT